MLRLIKLDPCGSPRNIVPIRQKVRYACYDNASGATMKFKALQLLVLSCILLSTNLGAQEVAKSAPVGRVKLGVVLEGGGALAWPTSEFSSGLRNTVFR